MGHRLIAATGALAAALGVVVWGIVAYASGQPAARNAAVSTSKGHSASVSKSRSASPPTLAASPSPSPTAPSVTAGMRLIFNQDFTAPLNSSVWDTCYPWAAGPAGCTNFSNPEDEWYLPSQVQVSGGALHLIAQMEPTDGTTKSGAPEQYACRSGMVTSYPGFQFEYGYVSFVAQVPMGMGLWSGLWLAAANLQWPPEIDVVESYGPPISFASTVFHGVNASAVVGHVSASQFASLASGWHTFSVLWTPQEITWYVDNTPVMAITSNVPHQPMYLIADLANYAGAQPAYPTEAGSCNGQLLIRSIDVWQSP